MEQHEYEIMAAQEETGFWHVGRREILRDVLGRYIPQHESRAILDVGCGTGGNMLLLKDFGNVTGVDFSDEALRFARNYGFTSLLRASATELPLADASFDVVSALDVLEHISEDRQAIAEVFRVLKPGGFFLVTVPAYQWLWSHHDQALHHVRRYSKADLLKKLTAAGFHIQEQHRFALLGVPMRLLQKWVWSFQKRETDAQKNKTSAPLDMPAFLLGFLRLEKRWLRHVPLPFGTSIVVLAQKE